MVAERAIAETVTDHEATPLRASGRSLAEASIRHRQGARARTAFTLIELLVVIGIVALLMAIFLPALQRVRSQARAVACQSNLRQWGVTLAMLAHDNDGRLPDATTPSVGVGVGGTWNTSLTGDIRPIVYHNKLILCPMATRREVRPDHQYTSNAPSGKLALSFLGGKSTAWWVRTTDLNDSSEPPLEISGSYGFNAHILKHGSDPERDNFSIDTYQRSGRNNVPILLDCAGESSLPSPRSDPPTYEDDVSIGPHDGYRANMKWFCINRHGGGVNSLFLDWSVRKVGLKELWTLKWHSEFYTANDWTRAGGVQPEDWPQWMRNFKDY